MIALQSQQITIRPLQAVRPSPENDTLYRPVDPQDLEILALAQSIQANGILEPLVVTQDGYIISGHRRHAAADLAGLTELPCRIVPFRRCQDRDEFVRLLREHNRQRDKTLDEKLREEVVAASPEQAYSELLAHRRQKSDLSHFCDCDLLDMGLIKQRKKISPAKAPMLAAILKVLNERSAYLPLTDRQIHYGLLNDPPLIHASKPTSRYANTLQSYKALTELLTRARFQGLIPMDAIADETRPVVTWEVHRDPRTFVRQEIDEMFRGYSRDLQVSQPNHLELVGEKNTVASILKPVAAEFCIPLTTGRGYCSVPPRQAMVERFKASGKNQLVVLLVSDFDPDGEEIAASFARSLYRDFGLDCVRPYKVALNAEQVQRFKLPTGLAAKPTSSQHAKFIERHGKIVYELEALPPHHLQSIVRDAIRGMLDRKSFDAEIQSEQHDAAFLETLRRRAQAALVATLGHHAQGEDS